ncbi:hypothetical protein SAMN04488571_102152 [Methanoculleus thermophilus]|jgi:hypothetical protein|uniref:Uncharacterized protein n=1 Tax=Methanoculleus thermophilus TaxID=2200 RepID=A0A1G8Y0N4_9EURY|nr:hypothetical protein SAMN04488571_102152 [Methanoculleus thermophilus]HQD24968.1 hypothetical protein [Methanoculleus thermophilus]
MTPARRNASRMERCNEIRTAQGSKNRNFGEMLHATYGITSIEER